MSLIGVRVSLNDIVSFSSRHFVEQQENRHAPTSFVRRVNLVAALGTDWEATFIQWKRILVVSWEWQFSIGYWQDYAAFKALRYFSENQSSIYIDRNERKKKQELWLWRFRDYM